MNKNYREHADEQPKHFDYTKKREYLYPVTYQKPCIGAMETTNF